MVGSIALSIMLMIAFGKTPPPVVVNTESNKEETKAKQMELVKLKQEEEAKAKQMELVKLKQEKEAKFAAFKDIDKEMVLIPAGKFMMGSGAFETGRKSGETQHEVTLTKHFYMGKYEVTQEQWESVMGSNPSSRTKGAKLPVTDVSWNDCQDFIKKLNEKTNSGYRLPTEAEWEYACRAGTTTAYAVGNSLSKGDANIDGDSIKEVGSYKPNALGLYDMHGNVYECCEDWKADYLAGAITDPKGPATGEHRVMRGGSFYTGGSAAGSSFRLLNAPSLRDFYSGLRLARTLNSDDLLKPDIKAFLLKAKKEEEAKAKQMELEKSKGSKEEVEDLGKGIKLEMVLIPAGKFMMGSPVSEKDRYKHETQHEVTLTKPFYMGKYEVTQEQWELVMGNNPSSKTKGAKLPVTDVSWNDCQDFIKKLNASTKGGYRLPYEGEWEYTCRAGTTTAYSVGDSITKNDAKYGTDKGAPADNIVAVGNYKPNGFGLYDMHGNVWEWCNDWYGSLQDDEVRDPKGPGTGDRIVGRGGSFRGEVWKVRSSFRDGDTPSRKDYNFGFRLARAP